MLILVCYDIADNRRRYRASRILEGYGRRVQESVFECHLDQGKLVRLKQELAQMMKETEDRVHYYPLCGKDQRGAMVAGQGTVTRDIGYLLV